MLHKQHRWNSDMQYDTKEAKHKRSDTEWFQLHKFQNWQSLSKVLEVKIVLSFVEGWGDSYRERDSWDTSNTVCFNLRSSYMCVLTFWKIIKLYTYECFTVYEYTFQ